MKPLPNVLGKVVVLDCGGRDEPLKEELISLLDFISPNEVRATKLDPNTYRLSLPAFLGRATLKKRYIPRIIFVLIS